MNFAEVFPRVGVGNIDQDFSRLNLNGRSQFLRDRVKILRQGSNAPQETLHQIESHLNSISLEPNILRQWNHYELAYEGFISAGRFDDLLGVVLDLRSCTAVLDPASQEIWSKRKLDEMEQTLRNEDASSTIREEIACLARAIYESGFRFVRDSDLRLRVIRAALFLNVGVSIAVAILLWLFQWKHVGPESAWQIALIAALGASGALLQPTIRLRRSILDLEDLRIQFVLLLFRAACGATLAIIVILFLRLGIVDFPGLHTGAANSTPFTPAAMYVIAFASGFAEQLIFNFVERVTRRPAKDAHNVQAS